MCFTEMTEMTFTGISHWTYLKGVNQDEWWTLVNKMLVKKWCNVYIYILYKTTFWWYTPIIYDKVWGCFYYFWLVGTFCPYIGNSNPKWRTHIFQRGWHHQPVVLLTMGMTSLWKYGSEFPSELFVQSPKRRLGRKCFSAPPGTTKKQQRKHTHTRWCPIVI